MWGGSQLRDPRPDPSPPAMPTPVGAIAVVGALAALAAALPPLRRHHDGGCEAWDPAPDDAAVPTVPGFPWENRWFDVTSPTAAGAAGTGLEVSAFVQPRGRAGGWSWSNAGVIADRESHEFLVVDSLQDVVLTRHMLDAWLGGGGGHARNFTFAGTLLVTHADVDHVNGIPAFDRGTKVVAHAAAAAELKLMPQSADWMIGVGAAIWRLLQSRLGLALYSAKWAKRWARPIAAAACYASLFEEFHMYSVPDLGGYAVEAFAEDERRLQWHGHTVILRRLGPAHTAGDVIVHVPAARVLFAGDVVFWGVTPVQWAGPARNNIAALDAVGALDVDLVVPGHGPVVDPPKVERLKAYWEFVADVAAHCHRAGTAAFPCAAEALADVPEPFAGWQHPERLHINVAVELRHLDDTGFVQVTHAEKLELILEQGGLLAAGFFAEARRRAAPRGDVRKRFGAA